MTLRFALLFLVLGTLSLNAAAESPAPFLTLERIEAERQRIENAQIADEEKRTQALAMLEGARARLTEAEQWRKKRARLESLLKQKERPLGKRLPHLSPLKLRKWDRERLEKELVLRKTRLQSLREVFDQQERALIELMAAAREGGGQIAETRKKLDEVHRSLEAVKTADPLLGPVQRLRLDARAQMLQEKLAFLIFRQNNIEPLMVAVQKRRDRLAEALKSLHSQIEQLQDLIQMRQEKALRKEMPGEAQKAFLPPVLQPLQQEISQLAAEHEKVLGSSMEADRDLSVARRRFNELKNDFHHVRHIVEVVGNKEAVATLLLGRLADLPSIQALHARVSHIEERLNELEIRQLYVEEWLREKSDFESWSRPYLEAVDEKERERLRHQLRFLWEDLRATRQSLLQTYTSYISKLSELAATLRRLQDLVAEYRAYLKKQLIWIPTVSPIAVKTPQLLLDGLRWLSSPKLWEEVVEDGFQVLKGRPFLVAVWVTGLIILLALRRQCRRWMRVAAEATRKVRTDSFSGTVLTLLSTVLLASPVALFLFGAGWLLAGQKGLHENSMVIGHGLIMAAQIEWLLSWLLQLTRTEGLARLHFGWSEPVRAAVHAQAGWLRPLTVPLTFLIQISAEHMEEAGLLAMGRLAFNVLMVVLLIAIYRIWRRGGSVMGSLENRPHGLPWVRFHSLWFPLVMMIPLGLITETLLGYFYMALLLTQYLLHTIILVLGLLLVRDLLLRWLSVVQRRMRFEEIVRRHREAAAEEGASPEELPAIPEVDELDYSQLSDQVRQLVQTGFLFTLFFGIWLIWQDLIPAFNVFGDIQLPLTTTKMEDGIVREVPMTLGDVLTGLLVGGLTLLAARKLPALLELTILQYLPLSRPSRYAISTLTQYLVAMIGIVLTFKALGLRWSSIQWLVAALSVGLGFGLQEVVANFVSGVILLFEQPIRVGDVVTVEGVTGTVARIRIRATTIVNWDRQELVIPNKSFITGQLINWTLSDTITRLVITVGVAYGSDVEKAMALMMQVAEENPKVLREPSPLVTFEGFGDNALTLLLRVYLGSVDIRLSTTTEIHKAINEKFERAGIVIAFPQRDIHIDTARPLELVLRQDVAK